MPKWSDTDKRLGNNKKRVTELSGSDYLPVIHQFTINNFQATIQESKTLISVSVFDQERIAHFVFKKTRLGVEANWSTVYKKYQGLGIGQKIYKKIIKLYGHLFSSSTLTGETGYGSFNLYQKLSKSKTYECFVVDSKTLQATPVKQITKELMRYKKERFVIQLKEI